MANKQIEFHEDAVAEYEASFDWYFERSPLAAKNFQLKLHRHLKAFQKPSKVARVFSWYPKVFSPAFSIRNCLS
jgi:plasmid stabilization system protein ParE